MVSFRSSAFADILAVTNLNVCPWAHVWELPMWLFLEVCGAAHES